MESQNKKGDNAPTMYLLSSSEIAAPGVGYI